jgi:hypothetical protein
LKSLVLALAVAGALAATLAPDASASPSSAGATSVLAPAVAADHGRWSFGFGLSTGGYYGPAYPAYPAYYGGCCPSPVVVRPAYYAPAYYPYYAPAYYGGWYAPRLSLGFGWGGGWWGGHRHHGHHHHHHHHRHR